MAESLNTNRAPESGPTLDWSEAFKVGTVKSQLAEGVTPDEAAKRAKEALSKLTAQQRADKDTVEDVVAKALKQAGIFKDKAPKSAVYAAAEALMGEIPETVTAPAATVASAPAAAPEKKETKAAKADAESPETKLEKAKAQVFGEGLGLNAQDLEDVDVSLASVVILRPGNRENLFEREGAAAQKREWISKKAWGVLGYKTEEKISDRELETLNRILDAVRTERGAKAGFDQAVGGKVELLEKFAKESKAYRQEALAIKESHQNEKGATIRLAHDKLGVLENEVRGKAAGDAISKKIAAKKTDLAGYFKDNAPNLDAAQGDANVANLAAVIGANFQEISDIFKADAAKGLSLSPAFWDSLSYHSKGGFDADELATVNAIAAAAVTNAGFRADLEKFGTKQAKDIETAEKPEDAIGREIFRKLGITATDRVKPDNIRLDQPSKGNNAINAVFDYVTDHGGEAGALDEDTWTGKDGYAYNTLNFTRNTVQVETLNALVAAIVPGGKVDQEKLAALQPYYTGKAKLDAKKTAYADNTDVRPTEKDLERKEIADQAKLAARTIRDIRKAYGEDAARTALVQLGYTPKAAKNAQALDLDLTLNLLATGELWKEPLGVTTAKADLNQTIFANKAETARLTKAVKEAEERGLEERDLQHFGYRTGSFRKNSTETDDNGRETEIADGSVALLNDIRDNVTEGGLAIDADEFKRRLENLRLYLASPESKDAFKTVSGKDRVKGRKESWEMSRLERNDQLAEKKTPKSPEGYFRLLADFDLSGTTDEKGGLFGEEQLGKALEAHPMTEAQRGYALLAFATAGGFDFKTGGPKGGKEIIKPTIYLEDVDSTEKAVDVLRKYPALLPYVRAGIKSFGKGWEAAVTGVATFDPKNLADRDPKVVEAERKLAEAKEGLTEIPALKERMEAIFQKVKEATDRATKAAKAGDAETLATAVDDAHWADEEGDSEFGPRGRAAIVARAKEIVERAKAAQLNADDAKIISKQDFGVQVSLDEADNLKAAPRTVAPTAAPTAGTSPAGQPTTAPTAAAVPTEAKTKERTESEKTVQKALAALEGARKAAKEIDSAATELQDHIEQNHEYDVQTPTFDERKADAQAILQRSQDNAAKLKEAVRQFNEAVAKLDQNVQLAGVGTIAIKGEWGAPLITRAQAEKEITSLAGADATARATQEKHDAWLAAELAAQQASAEENVRITEQIDRKPREKAVLKTSASLQIFNDSGINHVKFGPKSVFNSAEENKENEAFGRDLVREKTTAQLKIAQDMCLRREMSPQELEDYSAAMQDNLFIRLGGGVSNADIKSMVPHLLTVSKWRENVRRAESAKKFANVADKIATVRTNVEKGLVDWSKPSKKDAKLAIRDLNDFIEGADKLGGTFEAFRNALKAARADFRPQFDQFVAELGAQPAFLDAWNDREKLFVALENTQK